MVRCTSRIAKSPTLPVAPFERSPPSQGPSWRAKDRSADSAPPPPLPDPKRLPPAGPSQQLQTCVKSCRMGRHWSLGLAASVQLPACVHPRASELGPLPEPVIHRSAKGHMPPDDFYNDVDAGARPPTLRPRAHGEPYAWVTGPCGTGQPHTPSSGVERARSSHHALDGACLRPRGFSPTRSLHEHPLSLARTSLRVEDAKTSGSTEVCCSSRSPTRTLHGEVIAITARERDATSPAAHSRVTRLA